LILMDCNMPVKDGFQAANDINILANKNKVKYRPRISAVTAYSMEAFKQKAKNNKMDWFMTKPVKLRSLRKVIEHTFDWMSKR